LVGRTVPDPLEGVVGLQVVAIGLYRETIINDFVAVEEQGITAYAALLAKAHAGEPGPALDRMHPARVGDLKRVVGRVILEYLPQMGRNDPLIGWVRTVTCISALPAARPARPLSPVDNPSHAGKRKTHAARRNGLKRKTSVKRAALLFLLCRPT
jgi:hypothetical protein